MDARTYELLNAKMDVLLREATTAQLREIRERKNTNWRNAIDAEILARGETIESPRPAITHRPGGWKSRPGTLARFDEEDELIHGPN